MVTIVILIILATISVNLLFNKNGIIKQAQNAKKIYEEAEVKEKLGLYYLLKDDEKTIKDFLIQDKLVDKEELEKNGISNLKGYEDYYVICDLAGLKKLSDDTENGIDYTGKTVYLVNDIDCKASFNNQTGELSSGDEFKPISNFNGTFDGNDYEIKNLYINIADENASAALFKITNKDSIIKNLVISDSYINGNKVVGAIVGYNYGKIYNCVNNSQVNGGSLVGGIVGRTYNIIDNCKNYGNIKTTGYQTGGIVGNCDFGEEIKISNCKNYGNIVSTMDTVGGIVGGAWRGNDDFKNVNIEIINCENYGKVGGEEIYNCIIGGIVGESRATIKNCINKGEIKGYRRVGGIAGVTTYYNSKNTLIENCKNDGNVVGTYTEIGGICGSNSGRNNI